jgi:hypothetical protein
MRYLASVLALTLAVPVAPAEAQLPGFDFSSTAHHNNGADCRGLKLVAASDVPNGKRPSYRFAGSCRLTIITTDVHKDAGLFPDKDVTEDPVGSVSATVEVTWNRGTGKMEEVTLVKGDVAGRITMFLRCAEDPVVTSTTCVRIFYQNETDWTGFDGAWLANRPISRGKTTVAEASALSKGAKPDAWPPPDPKPVAAKAMSSPKSWGRMFEAESLLAVTTVTHGSIGVQGMTSYGTGWSGGAQLFWSVAVSGARLRVLLPPVSPGRYEVFLAYTRAPDYGLLKASFDGAPEVTLDGYAAKVAPARDRLAVLEFTTGSHELLLSVAGRDPASTGLRAGLDRIELRPVAGGK